MPTPELREWRSDITKAVNRLRAQFIFLFVFLVAALALITYRSVAADNDFAQLVKQIQVDRYNGCIQRVVDINVYNSRLGTPGLLPEFPVPNCPQRPPDLP